MIDENWIDNVSFIEQIAPTFTPEDWEKYAASDDDATRYALTRLDECPVHILELLSDDASSHVLEGVATHERTPVEVLDRLAIIGGNKAQAAVALNPSTRESTLWLLLDSDDVRVRQGLALNQYAPLNLLATLLQDPVPAVRYSLVHNRSLTAEMVEALRTHEDPLTREAASIWDVTGVWVDASE